MVSKCALGVNVFEWLFVRCVLVLHCDGLVSCSGCNPALYPLTYSHMLQLEPANIYKYRQWMDGLKCTTRKKRCCILLGQSWQNKELIITNINIKVMDGRYHTKRCWIQLHATLFRFSLVKTFENHTSFSFPFAVMHNC